MKTWHYIMIGLSFVVLGVAGDYAIQHIERDAPGITVGHVDLKSDTAEIEFHESFGNRLLGVAQKDHLALVAGGVAAWGAFAAAWKRRGRVA